MGEGKGGEDKVVKPHRRGFFGALVAGLAGAALPAVPVEVPASVKEQTLEQILKLIRERRDRLREEMLEMKYPEVHEFDNYAEEKCR